MSDAVTERVPSTSPSTKAIDAEALAPPLMPVSATRYALVVRHIGERDFDRIADRGRGSRAHGLACRIEAARRPGALIGTSNVKTSLCVLETLSRGSTVMPALMSAV
jgi:hypothetical protein